jgi:hypothetical protein
VRNMQVRIGRAARNAIGITYFAGSTLEMAKPPRRIWAALCSWSPDRDQFGQRIYRAREFAWFVAPRDGSPRRIMGEGS